MHGVDVARAVAVAGMVMVHFGPTPVPDTFSGSLYGLSEGRASVLFALLAGVGVALLAGDRGPASGPDGGESPVVSRTARARGRLALRGLLLLPLGLWLQQLDHGALVILQYYAIYFLLAALVIAWPDRWLLAGAGAALVLGPVAHFLSLTAAPEWYAVLPATLGDSASKIVHNLLLSGAYPLVTWAAPLLFGIWLGRANLGTAPARRRLLAGGAAVAGLCALASTLASAFSTAAVPAGISQPEALALLTSDEPHGQTFLWMAGSMGSACAVLGGTLMLAGSVRRSPRPLRPLIVAGQMALSVYVGHLLLLHYAGSLQEPDGVDAALLAVGTFMTFAVAACLVWRRAVGRGPLESALALPWRAVERLAMDRPSNPKDRK